MNKAEQVKTADQAREALISDIREIKDDGREVLAKVESKLPWIAGGVVAIAAIGIGIAIASKPRRAFLIPRRQSLFGKAVRAALLSAIGIGTRRLVVRGLDKVLPEKNAEQQPALQQPVQQPT